MDSIIKIKKIGVSKLNNAEYTQFMSNVKKLIEVATIEKIGIDTSLFDSFQKQVEILTDLANHNRSNSETEKLNMLNKKRIEMFIYLRSYISIERKSPIEEHKKSANYLYTLAKSYTGSQKLPNRQRTQVYEGFILDLEKEESTKHIQKLGLSIALKELKESNLDYKTLTSDRAESQLANTIENAKEVRKLVDKQYDKISTLAFVKSVSQPTDEVSKFIASLNKLIDDTSTAYKQRNKMKKIKTIEANS
jgi:hypothetical protein